MSISLIIFIILHVVVLAYVAEMLRRLVHRAREYPLEETRASLPFGFLKLRYIVLLFLAGYVIWFIFSLWLYGYFVGSLNDAILRI